jgi:hypothetical protein
MDKQKMYQKVVAHCQLNEYRGACVSERNFSPRTQNLLYAAVDTCQDEKELLDFILENFKLYPKI